MMRSENIVHRNENIVHRNENTSLKMKTLFILLIKLLLTFHIISKIALHFNKIINKIAPIFA